MPDARVRQHGEKSYLQETLLIWICQSCNDFEMHHVARVILFRCGNDFPIGFPFNNYNSLLVHILCAMRYRANPYEVKLH